MNKIVHCIKCKRQILEHEVDKENQIVYCYGCNFYFPLGEQNFREREEIKIPNGTSYIRLRINEDSLEIKVKWFGNYSLMQIMKEYLDEDITAIFSTIAYFINRTTIEANQKSVSYTHLTLPTIYSV